MEPNEKWAIIINLKSGKKQFRQQINYLFRELERAQIEYDYKITEFAGHAILIARHYARENYLNFLVVGGDGTISEVVNGIFSVHQAHQHPIKIGLIPRGTGNDWARFWGLTRDYVHSVDTFLKGRVQLIDLGRVDYQLEGESKTHFFINSIGFGLDAAVAQSTNRIKKWLGSHSFMYSLALLMAVFRFRANRMEISSKGSFINDYIFTMNIANGSYCGGGMQLNPQAVPYDGLLDVMMARKPRLKDILSALPLIFNGKLLEHPVIESFRTDEINLDCTHGGIFEADGILVHCAPPLSVNIMSGVLQMVVPSDSSAYVLVERF